MATVRINLLPGAAGKRGAGGGFDVKAIVSFVREHGREKYTIIAVAAGVLAIVAISYMIMTSGSRSAQLAERERRAVQDSSRFAAVLRDRAQAEAQRDAVLRQLAIIQSIDDKRYVWPHLLEEISRALPAFTWLTAITQTSAPVNAAITDSAVIALRQKEDTTKPAGRARVQRARRDAAITAGRSTTRFRVVGNTVDIQALTRFMKDLEGSSFIQSVQLARSDLVTVEGKEITEFQLDAESEAPDSTEITVVPVSMGGR